MKKIIPHFLLFSFFVFVCHSAKSQPLLLKVLPDNSANFTTAHNNLYFTVGDSLWKSNGTPSGTVFVKEIGEPIQRLTNFTVGTFFYFLTTEPGGNTALWKSNGTSVNTFKIASHPVIQPLLVYKNALILGIDNGINGYELWRATSGNVFTLVRDIYPGIGSGLGNEIVIMNDLLYFKANSGAGGINIWKSNGTSVTSLVADLPFDDYHNLTVVNDLIFFSRNYSDITGNIGELWKTNGTASGTVVVKQFIETDDICHQFVSHLTSYNNKLFFDLNASCGTPFENLWSSDGTEAGTVFIKLINIDGYVYPFIKLNNRLVFHGSSQGFPGSLWRSNGTTAGTEIFYNMQSEPTGEFERVGNLLFFADHSSATFGSPDSPNDYFQLFQSGLHEENTEPVKNIYGGSYAGAANLRNANGKLFFTTFNDYPGAPAEDQVLRLYYYDPTVVLRTPAMPVASIQSLKAFPNPSNSNFKFNVTASSDANAKAEIYSVDGILVNEILDSASKAGDLIEFEWNATDNLDGVYICKYRCGEDFKVIKIVKTR